MCNICQKRDYGIVLPRAGVELVCKQKSLQTQLGLLCCKTWEVPVNAQENMEYDLFSIFQGLSFKYAKNYKNKLREDLLE